ncbi:MAG: YjjG family noncanonical pyrimidine nucleotidase [Clostridia bacterium]|nr:YjjG family noncanonical pyrimidine nucleotidase [Clostridia bacterium]
MKIKAVLMDVDNTLLDFGICARDSMRGVFADWGVPYREEMFPVFWEINGKLWEEIEEGHLTKEELYQIRWKLIFERLGIEGYDPVRFDDGFRKYIAESAAPVEGAYEILEYLSPKYILCVASNASPARQIKRLTKANMLQYFEHLFTSEEIGHPKPEKAFFDACLKTLDGITAAETVVIGDSLTADIAGGAGCGMKTIWYNHTHEAVPEKLRADYIVNTLLEIKDIL